MFVTGCFVSVQATGPVQVPRPFLSHFDIYAPTPKTNQDKDTETKKRDKTNLDDIHHFQYYDDDGPHLC